VREHRGRLIGWSLALLPLVAGVAAWAVVRSGLVPDERVAVALSALRSDWLLALGALASALMWGVFVLRSRREHSFRRLLAEQTAETAHDRRLLLSRLDHELKNPLTAMRAALANVSASADGADRESGLRSIEAQVMRLSRLTADLRKVADVAGSDLDHRPVDVVALVEEAIDIAGGQPATAGRRLSVDLGAAPLPRVVGDPDLLAQALVNLVDNAIKYTSPGDRIELRAREAPGAVAIEVADTGPGVPEADLPHIWEELYRSPGARAVPGSGLGLALVRAVVERHGGTVEAQSWLGHGTVVRILLPSAGPPGAGAAPGGRTGRQKAAEPAT
jgi:two-component system OmpR family sensor kinase